MEVAAGATMDLAAGAAAATVVEAVAAVAATDFNDHLFIHSKRVMPLSFYGGCIIDI